MYGRGNVSFGPPITPPIVKNLIIANVGIFVLQAFFPFIRDYGAASPYAVWIHGYVWQPFTYMWLHAGLWHIAFNMLALWMFGSQLAMTWGEERFLRYYLICGVGAGIVITTLPWLPVVGGWTVSGDSLLIPTVGASGAVMGVLLAFSFTWPERTVMLIFPPIPLKAIWLIPLIFVMDIAGPQAATISHAGHLGGAVVGWIYLVREGRTPGAPTLDTLKHRYKRYRMRQKLRMVHDRERREQQDRWRDRDNDDNEPPRFH